MLFRMYEEFQKTIMPGLVNYVLVALNACQQTNTYLFEGFAFVFVLMVIHDSGVGIDLQSKTGDGT